MGVIVVDNGSLSAESNDALIRFVEAYLSSFPDRPIVEAAHMALAGPPRTGRAAHGTGDVVPA